MNGRWLLKNRCYIAVKGFDTLFFVIVLAMIMIESISHQSRFMDVFFYFLGYKISSFFQKKKQENLDFISPWKIKTKQRMKN